MFKEDLILLTRLRTRDWDISGGVINPGETAEEAAVREVLEETSVANHDAIYEEALRRVAARRR